MQISGKSLTFVKYKFSNTQTKWMISNKTKHFLRVVYILIFCKNLTWKYYIPPNVFVGLLVRNDNEGDENVLA